MVGRMKELEEENQRLKKMYADAQLSADLLKPSRCRQRVSELGLHGRAVWNTTSPVKNCQ